MKIETILDDKEKAEIQQLLDRPTLLNAIKKVLLFGVYQNGTLRPGEDPEPFQNFALTLVWDRTGGELKQSDEELGQRLRASAEGIRFLITGFETLESFKKKPVEETSDNNPAI